jgi:hypothetical protein
VKDHLVLVDLVLVDLEEVLVVMVEDHLHKMVVFMEVAVVLLKMTLEIVVVMVVWVPSESFGDQEEHTQVLT